MTNKSDTPDPILTTSAFRALVELGLSDNPQQWCGIISKARELAAKESGDVTEKHIRSVWRTGKTHPFLRDNLVAIVSDWYEDQTGDPAAESASIELITDLLAEIEDYRAGHRIKFRKTG